MLTSSKQMILEAQKGGYAIGCFNTSDLEMTKAIVLAAINLKSPVIISTSERAIEYAGLKSLAAIIKEEAKNTTLPVTLHLDHGKSLEVVKGCLEAGYTSVMFDGSDLPFRENIGLTKQAVQMAHLYQVPCEGELGHFGKIGENRTNLTNPDEITEYIQETGVDFLAVSIGSEHGRGESEILEIELLKKIRLLTNLPLVLHGASGVSDEDIKAAVQNGICKINIDTDIRQTFAQSLREALAERPQVNEPREILTEAIADVQKLVEEKIRLFGSEGKGQ